jgi:hypothetical protein
VIVSHRHRFIFLKTKKTAGTSLEIALAGICGPADVITPIPEADESERRRLGHRGPQNTGVRIGLYRSQDLLQLALHRRRLAFTNHTTALEARRLVSREIWSGYYKFCFDRNPWDKAVSHYHWQGGDRRFGSVKEFLLSGRGQPYSNYQLYSIRGFVAVDRVYRYEELESALEDLTRRLGLDAPLRMPEFRAKGGSRPDRRPYREALTEEEAEMIAVACAREIRLLGYSF